jgi:hypothetical protein
VGSGHDAGVSGLNLLFHLHSNLPEVFDESLFVLLAVRMLAAGLGRAVLQEDSAVFAVKLLAHLYNRPIIIMPFATEGRACIDIILFKKQAQMALKTLAVDIIQSIEAK